MVIITTLYCTLVYLLFFKFRVAPWNKATQFIVVLLGVIILSAFLVGLQGLTPSSVQGSITGRMAEVAPQVSGRVTAVNVEPNVPVSAGDVLFELDPTAFQATLDDVSARLELARLRLEQFEELAGVSAASQFQLEQSQYDVRSLEAQLENARFNLDNTIVRASEDGIAPRMFLEVGTQVMAGRSVMTFVDTGDLIIMGQFQQKSLANIKAGDNAKVNFPALPGQVFESRVIAVPSAIGNAQLIASAQLPSTQQVQTTRLYPVIIELPAEFPEELHKVGLAATVYVHTENAGVVGIVAVILQWIGTSLDAIL